MQILIGGAWPYANGPLHLGHLAGLLPGDVLARYHRAKGDRVTYVSGSDCYGTPVAVRARREGTSPAEISAKYHREFTEVFEAFGFSYDRYGHTTSEEHRAFVQRFHRKLYEGMFINEHTAPQAYCPRCEVFLADRFVVGTCPACGEEARGDQCDACGAVLEPEQLEGARCTVCGETPTFRPSTHLFIDLPKLAPVLRAYHAAHPNWRKNVQAFTARYVEEGLRERAITRDLSWGIEVPKAGYEDKRVYIWAENVLGYLSMSEAVLAERGEETEALWGTDAKHYYVHGKDNIPFHTIILPALLLASGESWHLPDEIIASEYLTLEGKKFSTSRNWAVWAKNLVGRYDIDSLRFALLAHGPERRDADFSWQAYAQQYHGELVGAYGNFVHRTLAFVERFLDGVVPEGEVGIEEEARLSRLYTEVGQHIEGGRFRDALLRIFEEVREGNQYYDAEQPWRTRTKDDARCRETIFQCVQRVANLAVLMQPFLPFSSQKVFGWLGLSADWRPQFVTSGARIAGVSVLFERLPLGRVEEEVAALNASVT